MILITHLSRKERPTYDIVDQSKIILTVESTLGYEAMARGKSVYFSLRKTFILTILLILAGLQ